MLEKMIPLPDEEWLLSASEEGFAWVAQAEQYVPTGTVVLNITGPLQTADFQSCEGTSLAENGVGYWQRFSLKASDFVKLKDQIFRVSALEDIEIAGHEIIQKQNKKGKPVTQVKATGPVAQVLVRAFHGGHSSRCLRGSMGMPCTEHGWMVPAKNVALAWLLDEAEDAKGVFCPIGFAAVYVGRYALKLQAGEPWLFMVPGRKSSEPPPKRSRGSAFFCLERGF